MKRIIPTMSHLSKREERKAMNAMKREIEEILNTYDFSNFEAIVDYDVETNTMIVPKPVFAFTLICEDAKNWVQYLIDEHPDCQVAIV